MIKCCFIRIKEKDVKEKKKVIHLLHFCRLNGYSELLLLHRKPRKG